MKENGKTNNKAKDKANGNGSGPMLKFNHIRRETLPQTRIDVRALEMVRGYPLYVKEHTDHEPPIGEVLEQCIINTLSGDADFVEWLAASPARNWPANRVTIQHPRRRTHPFLSEAEIVAPILQIVSRQIPPMQSIRPNVLTLAK